jgi:hypothetical protein
MLDARRARNPPKRVRCNDALGLLGQGEDQSLIGDELDEEKRSGTIVLKPHRRSSRVAMSSQTPERLGWTAT